MNYKKLTWVLLGVELGGTAWVVLRVVPQVALGVVLGGMGSPPFHHFLQAKYLKKGLNFPFIFHSNSGPLTPNVYKYPYEIEGSRI